MSLEWFRRHQKHFLAFLAVFLMVAWGMGGSLGFIAGRRWAGRVFGKKIDMADIETMYARWVRSQPEGRYRRPLSKADFWQNYIFLHEARQSGLEVSDGEVEMAVKASPMFMGKEGFSLRRYQEFLLRQGIEEEAYEETLRERLLIRKLLTFIGESAKVSTDEAWQRYASESEEVKVKYLALRAADLMPDIKVTPDELKSFYETHKGQFPDPAQGKPGYKRGESAQVEYLIARKDDLLDPGAVSEKEIKKYYDEHKESYRIKDEKKGAKDAQKKDADKEQNDPNAKKDAEEKKPEHRPLAEVKDEIRKKLAEEKADERLAAVMDKIGRKIDNRLDTQFSLAAIADEMPQKAVGYVRTAFLTEGEIGILPGRLSFEKDIAARDDGTPSAILDCPKGKFVYQVLSIRPTQVVPFDEARRQVEADLKRDKALKMAMTLAEACRAKTKTFDDCVKMLRERLGKQGKNLTTADSNFFTRPKAFRFMGPESHQFDTGVPGDHPKFAEEAFRLNKGRIGLALEEGKDPVCYLMTLAGQKPANKDTFKKEEKRLLLGYAREKTSTAQRAWMAELNKRADLERLMF